MKKAISGDRETGIPGVIVLEPWIITSLHLIAVGPVSAGAQVSLGCRHWAPGHEASVFSAPRAPQRAKVHHGKETDGRAVGFASTVLAFCPAAELHFFISALLIPLPCVPVD